MSSTESSIAIAQPPELPEPPRTCPNCGAPQLGRWCYACGQDEKSPVRYLPEVVEDLADLAFNVDSRIFRSLWDLFARPGYMTVQYFLGHRARYVSPFRLFFFLCIISFFAMQVSISDVNVNFETTTSAIDAAQTPAEVKQKEDGALAALHNGEEIDVLPAKVLAKLKKQERAVHEAADTRLAWLKARDEAEAAGKEPPPDPEDWMVRFNGQPFDPEANPWHIDSLPDFVNRRLKAMGLRLKENIKDARYHPEHIIAGLFSVLPQTLFLLMPLFAVLLKIAYIFKRRLYMEHLVVALHSHAFIFQLLLVIVLLTGLRGWLSTAAPPVATALGYAIGAAWIWLPVYLLIMQKRVYRQGWWLTGIKYTFIGFFYTILVSFGLVGALLVSLTTT